MPAAPDVTLTDEQCAKLAEFQGVSGVNDIEVSLRVLETAGWDLNAAVNIMLNEQTGQASPARSPPPKDAPVAPPPGASGPERTEITEEVNDYFGGRYGVLGVGVSYGVNVVRGVVRFIFHFVASLIPVNVVRFLTSEHMGYDPRRAADLFINSFETNYGRDHPPFFEGSFADAVSEATSSLRLLVVYLHSPNHEATPEFCTYTLCSPNVIRLLTDRFVVYGGNVNHPEAYQLSQSFGVTSYPFIAAVSAAERGGVLTVLDRMDRLFPAGPDVLCSRLQSVLAAHDAVLEDQRQEREARELDRQLREEQNRQYEESLEADRRKREEARRAEMEAQLAVQEMQSRTAREKARERDREMKRVALPPEPTGDDVCRILLRLPDGSRTERRFLPSDTLEALFLFVESHDIGLEEDADAYEVVQNFPRAVFDPRSRDDRLRTFKDAELMPQASLHVQDRL